MAQPQLRKKIDALRCIEAVPEYSFVPQKLLYRLLTRNVVSTAIESLAQIPGYRVIDIVDKIMKGGQKVFAILVLLKGEEARIVDFMKHDQFQHAPLDFKLPFSMETLSGIVPEIAEEFYRIQWEFVAPVFSRGVVHRELHERTRLPFVQNVLIGDGGFGDVYEVELHPDHQIFPFVPEEDVSS
jgi:hypothetical protein